MDSFVHLEVQSAFSFLWGTFTPEDLVQEVCSLGQKAVALTDDTLYGAVRFYRAAAQSGIQAILGGRIIIRDGSPITLLASNLQGYGNLCRLISVASGDGTQPKHPVSKTDLARWSDGLICLAGGGGSGLRALLEEHHTDRAEKWLLDLKEIFPCEDRLFVVLQNHEPPINPSNREYPSSAMRALMEQTLALAIRVGIPVVATNHVVFLRPEDYVIHRTLVDIQVSHHHRSVTPLPHDRFSLVCGTEMLTRVPYAQAIENTWYIAELCRGFSLPVGKLHPPRVQNPAQAAKKLTRLCIRKTAKVFRPASAAHIRQLDRELEVIRGFGLSDFFLLVREVVEFARARGLRHSVRGSAASSLVVYLLLGGVDPVTNNLLFERFINEGRGDMPDVDLDFDSERREEVITHLMSLFPRQTAMVATIHTFKVRSAVRLAGRALGYSPARINHLATCLPWSLRGRNLHEALANLPELKDSPLHKEPRLVELASKIIGLPFQSSVHLGGVIVAPGDIMEWTPVGKSPNGLRVGHLDKDDVDALGLLKLDLLGLRMHTAIRKSLEILKNKGIDLNLDRIPLDDRKTYALLRSTESLGVFQLESPGQRNLLGRLQPRCFSDLTAEISLFRPGPVEGNIVDPYVKRRHGEQPVTVPHEDLLPILAETYGLILFQEQVLKIVHTFSGLSYGEADAFRRAMTKDRKSRKMDLLTQQFIKGALAKGHSEELAEKVFSMVAAFASYGFCKAHAASFAHITYQSAYLKAHHPQAFYLGLLNAGQVGSYPPSVILNEARRRGIPVYPPHVNASGTAYQPDGSGIRVPLTVIHSLGPTTARRVVTERMIRGIFRNRLDFRTRVALPKRIEEFLTLAGALDGLNEHDFDLIQEVCNV